MPASITISELAWATPDGRTLFSNLDLSFGSERAGLVGRNGVGKSTLLRLIAGETTPAAGTVSVDGRIGVLRQSVQVTPEETIADLFAAADALALLARAVLARFMFRADAALRAAGALSGGQMLRAGLACVLGVAPPPLLILDEPTNHLDIESIKAVEAGLRGMTVR
jgi:ATPase subunit of ABC transporter with duplicated ATPase domains